MQATGELVAGRELDVLVAKKVMGWMVPPEHPLPSLFVKCLPAYSTDIAAAWQVVEHMTQLWKGRLRICLTMEGARIECDMVALTGHGRIARAQNATAPLAICRAALRAVSRDE